MPAKKMFKRISLPLVMLCAFLIPAALFAQKDLPITVESGIIPPEFNLNNDTLLIYSPGNPFYVMSMKKHFKKSYTGTFIFAKNLSEYSVDKCRYVLFEGTSNTTITTIGGPNNGQSRNMVGHGSFYILDRKRFSILVYLCT